MKKAGNRKLNILFILSDDQGSWALGCAGNKELRTPNLDRLAAEGLMFNNFFCVTPVCSPARASILTGQIPSQHGVHDWIASGSVDMEKLTPDMRDRMHLKNERKPIEYLKGKAAYTEILAENDYFCGLSGKWHLGNSHKAQKGFEYWETVATGGCNYYNSEIIHNGELCIGETYITDIITDNAIKFLEKSEKDDRPFYLGVHYTAPHSPWNKENHPSEIWETYNDCKFESVPDEPLHPWIIEGFKSMKGDKRREALQGYYSAITAMDKGIGDIIEKIDGMGIRNETLIIFTSDNGMNMGHHGIFGKGNGTSPLNMYDTSVKVPMIISLTGRGQKGELYEGMLSHYDILPTLLDYLDFENLYSEKLPGKSFASLLKGDRAEGKGDIVIFDEYGPAHMIRTTEWKYIHRHPNGPHELYDLINDPGEKCNIIDFPENQELIKNLRLRLSDWFIKYANPDLEKAGYGVSGRGQIKNINDIQDFDEAYL